MEGRGNWSLASFSGSLGLLLAPTPPLSPHRYPPDTVYIHGLELIHVLHSQQAWVSLDTDYHSPDTCTDWPALLGNRGHDSLRGQSS